jgi:hypothetical protein
VTHVHSALTIQTVKKKQVSCESIRLVRLLTFRLPFPFPVALVPALLLCGEHVRGGLAAVMEDAGAGPSPDLKVPLGMQLGTETSGVGGVGVLGRKGAGVDDDVAEAGVDNGGRKVDVAGDVAYACASLFVLKDVVGAKASHVVELGADAVRAVVVPLHTLLFGASGGWVGAARIQGQ